MMFCIVTNALGLITICMHVLCIHMWLLMIMYVYIVYTLHLEDYTHIKNIYITYTLSHSKLIELTLDSIHVYTHHPHFAGLVTEECISLYNNNVLHFERINSIITNTNRDSH